MTTTVKVATAICIFAGFLWLRTRSRRLNVEDGKMRIVTGIFVLLPALLVAQVKLFEKAGLEPWLDLAARIAALIATFAFAGYVFLRPPKP